MMRRSRAALLALAMAVPFTVSVQATEGPTSHTSAAVRTTFVVQDIDRAVRFYTHVFGYKVKYDGRIGAIPANKALMALAKDQDARFVILDSERTFSGRKHDATGIGLLAFPGQRKPRLAQPRGNRFATGQAMIAMMTSDLGTVLARLSELGAPILAGPVAGHEGRETEIVTRDPDGTRIHVVERRPD